MITSDSIITLAKALEGTIRQIERKDTEGWTLDECHAIQDALHDLGVQASILFLACMTEEEMAEAEREGRDDGS